MALIVLPLVSLAACGGLPAPAAPTISAPGARGDGQNGAVTELARLKGLTPVQLKTVLGQPGFTRRDAPAEIWQYRGKACTLDLFLYDGGDGQQVDHYAVRAAGPMAEKECFDQLIARPAPRS